MKTSCVQSVIMIENIRSHLRHHDVKIQCVMKRENVAENSIFSRLKTAENKGAVNVDWLEHSVFMMFLWCFHCVFTPENRY